VYNSPRQRRDIEQYARPVQASGVVPAAPLVLSRDRPVHLLRRFAAVCYDTLLLLAVLFLAGLPLPLIPAAWRDTPWVHYATLGYIVAVSFVFFGWFWTHGGQTLGMRAWGFRLIDEHGTPPGWRPAWRRFSWALVSWAALGLGFLWSLIDRDHLAWHDHLSGTRLVRAGARSQPTQQPEADAEKDDGG